MVRKVRIEAPDEFYTDLSVGEILRRARLQTGQTIWDAERALRIRAQHLDALEKGEFERLPGRVYAIGFVRTYAEYLGLDGGRTVTLLKRQVRGLAVPQALTFAVPAGESHMPARSVTAAAVVALAVVAVLWAGVQNGRLSGEPEIPKVPEGTVPVAMTPEGIRADLEKQSPPQKIQETPSLTVTEAPLEIEVMQDSWMEIRNSIGRVVEARLFRAGETVPVAEPVDAAGQPWSLTVGNAGGVHLRVGGRDLPPLGEQGKVHRNIKLDPADLTKAPAKKRL